MNKILTDKVIKRLTLYHFILRDYLQKNIENISSPQIAELLHIDNTQVRKDIALIDYRGKCKVGYNVNELKNKIEKALGFKSIKTAVIIGAGNLGMALAKYDNFETYGFKIIALFDNSPSKVGLKINDKTVFNIEKVPEIIKKENIKIGILTVPRQFAQEVTDFIIASGIEYIWNFTPCILNIPSNIQVWNENLVGNFLQFTADCGVEKK